jgi:aminoglycoside phosphotransferase (APT) family kinase protein
MTDTHSFLQALQAYLSAQMGESVTISDPKPLAGGASRDTWLFTASTPTRTERLVLRRDLPTQMFDDALTREQEFRVMRTAYEHGVKVANVRYLCTDPSVLGGQFFIMDYVAGISIGVKVVHAPELAQARAHLPEQLAEQLARIHTMPTQDLPFLAHTDAPKTIAQMYSILDALQVKSPTWEWCLRWAQRHQPQASLTCYIHGDYRIGNLLIDETGLTAVIDWEFGHLGDPNEELAYICMRDWRFGNGNLHFGGISDRETFLRAYERHSGQSVHRASVDWWEIMGNIRWGIICMSQANRHLSGAEPSVELASLGRRSAEMQLEALRLIERYGKDG